MDILVWGATGFTGRLVVDYLARRYWPDDGLRWGIAGRNRQKLEALRMSLPGAATDIPIVVADAEDASSMGELARAASVILTTVGPYAKYGTPLLEACVKTGTDYCDLCGEVQWMRQMIDRHEAAARATGARIVMSCGFDSVPSDLGVYTLQAIARRMHGESCNTVAMRVRALKGGASGGTIASMINAIEAARADRRVARILADPHALVPDGDRMTVTSRDQRNARYDREAKVWTAPFVMASVNTRVVHRSNALLGHPWGTDFRYGESTVTGPGLAGRLRAHAISLALKAFLIANAVPLTRRLLKGFLPKPGDGPSPEEQTNGYYKLAFEGFTPRGKQVALQVTGDRDPGYGSTSKMLTECAVSLVIDDIPPTGGFWTPAALLGGALQRRLVSNAGLEFIADEQKVLL